VAKTGEKPQTRDNLPAETTSGIPIRAYYGEPAPGASRSRAASSEEMYRARYWTMRQYAGFGSARESNRRYRYLPEKGQTGLSVAFDLPTQMGYDSDDPLARGEVGKVGVAIARSRTWRSSRGAAARSGLDLDDDQRDRLDPARAPARRRAERGVPWDALSGTVQNDLLKEYVARGTYIFPPRASLQITTDIFAFCAAEVPRWNTISISGYHIREAGSTAVQEVAFTLRTARLRRGRASRAASRSTSSRRGCPSSSTPTRTSSRRSRSSVRRAALGRDRARPLRREGPRSLELRFHAQTAGSTLTAQQPDVNVVRVACRRSRPCWAARRASTRTRGRGARAADRGLGALALRTQQVIAYETRRATSRTRSAARRSSKSGPPRSATGEGS
jgi:methylmalonyl-CoA mutase N-terminal domain/subunit